MYDARSSIGIVHVCLPTMTRYGVALKRMSNLSQWCISGIRHELIAVNDVLVQSTISGKYPLHGFELDGF